MGLKGVPSYFKTTS